MIFSTRWYTFPILPGITVYFWAMTISTSIHAQNTRYGMLGPEYTLKNLVTANVATRMSLSRYRNVLTYNCVIQFIKAVTVLSGK